MSACTPPACIRHHSLTVTGPREVVVVLGHVGHDAETVGDTHGHHIAGVQESRDPQLLLGHFKGLNEMGAKGRGL